MAAIVKKGLYMLFTICILMLAGSCAKSQYQTRAGKKKQKHYDKVQYPKAPGRVNNARNTSR